MSPHTRSLSPSSQIVVDKDGNETIKISKPWTLERRIKRIKSDWEKNPDTDIRARWHSIKPFLRLPAELIHGKMPDASIFDADQEQATQYSAEDADATRRLGPILLRQAKQEKLTRILDTDMPALPLIARMENNGFPADRKYFGELAKEMRVRQAHLKKELEALIGHPINPNSPDQVAELLFDELGLKPSGHTSTGKLATSKKVLVPYRADNTIVDKILTYKELLKIETAFCGNIANSIISTPKGSRCFTTIRATRVITGRLATSSPNLLAIPVRSDEGKRVREGFIAPDGYLIGAFDLSQIEMRVMAHRSLDEPLLEVYNRSKDVYPKHERDVHIMTAAAVYGKKPIDVSDHERTLAKSTGFGILMGMSGSGLAAQMRLYGQSGHTVEECDQFIEEWLESHPGVRDYQLAMHARARRYGYVDDMFGRRYRLPAARSRDQRISSGALRQSHALDIQGSAQGIFKRIMRRIEFETIPKLAAEDIDIEPILQVHDEQILLFREEHAEKVIEAMLDVMSNTIGLVIPIEASASVSKTWGGIDK